MLAGGVDDCGIMLQNGVNKDADGVVCRPTDLVIVVARLAIRIDDQKDWPLPTHTTAYNTNNLGSATTISYRSDGSASCMHTLVALLFDQI